MEEFKDRFIADALELLEKLEKNLLLLEAKPDNIILIDEIFRGLHSLKGASAMYGFSKIGELIHLFENVYECVREKKCSVCTNVVNLSLNVVDFTSSLLKLREDVSGSSIAEYTKLEQEISEYLGQGPKIKERDNTGQEDEIIDKTYYISFTLDDNFEQRGVKLKLIFKQLDKHGSVISIPLKDKEKSLKSWEVFVVSKSPLENIEDVFIFMMDITNIELLAKENLFLNDEFNSIVQKNSALKQKNNLEGLKNIIKKASVEKDKPNEAQTGLTEKKPSVTPNFLKISADKLDEQMDLLSELVTIKAELRLIVKAEKIKKLYKLVEAADKVTNRFRRNILNVRLIQIKTLYVVFLRLVRDISKQLGKNVEFVADGLETELDKNIIDSLESPLTHLIRNSLDHGIESEEEREKAGKKPKGVISFNTYHSGSDIIIEIKDDGRGIDKNKIRNKAIEKGLIRGDMELTDKQLYDLIFMPGFSTAQNLTDVSGRGVGMDVVKKHIDQLRGEVEIKSEQGKGTSTIITLPQSLSIIDTLLVQTGKQFYAIPLQNVFKCTQLKHGELEQSANHQLKIEDELLPYIHLREVFLINGQEPESQKAVIVSNGTYNVGLVVDKVIGEYQAVLKPLDGYLIDRQYYTGASVLADGKLCVILDINKLIEDKRMLTKNYAI